MGIKYLWDTNTVIYFLQNQFPKTAEMFIDETLKSSRPAISAITEIELLSWKTEDEGDLKVLSNFISETKVFDIEKAVRLKAAEIRKKYSTRLPDAVIAATAIIYGLKLLTRNISDFKKIDELEVINPFER